jgi:ribose transport system ATP-binding protein
MPALRVARLGKTFPGTRALSDVDLDVRAGEIHALVGGNGSGKSTLVKVLAGVYHGDPGGLIEVHGRASPADQWSPDRAFAAGMRFVHQNPGVFRDLTVAENIAIGHGFPTGLGGRIRWRELHDRTRRLIDRYQIRARPETPVAALKPADRTMVAVARALQDSAFDDVAHNGILFLDEPTTSLPATDTEILLDALRRCAAAGQTIVYVSHRIDEVLSLADRVTVLRDGKKVATADTGDVTEAAVVELLAGRALAHEPTGNTGHAGGEVVLELSGLAAGPLRGIDLRLHRGEVLGVAGLLGSGRTELLQTIFGAGSPTAGEIRLQGGRPARFSSPADAMAAGIAYVPEDRAAEAVFASMTVRENLSAGGVRRYWRWLRLQHGWERRDAQAAMREFLVRATSDRAPLSTLSGGNQQKVVLARWLRRSPAILLLDEPTQGVDVAARQEIYGLVRRAAAAGTAIIMVANDFSELARLCHRVVVLRGGRIAADISAPWLDSHRLTELAYLAEVSDEH